MFGLKMGTFDTSQRDISLQQSAINKKYESKQDKTLNSIRKDLDGSSLKEGKSRSRSKAPKSEFGKSRRSSRQKSAKAKTSKPPKSQKSKGEKNSKAKKPKRA